MHVNFIDIAFLARLNKHAEISSNFANALDQTEYRFQLLKGGIYNNS